MANEQPTPIATDAIPTLHSPDATRSIAWLVDVLGLREIAVMRDATGRVVHGELAFGTNGVVLMSDEPTADEQQRALIRTGIGSVYLVCDEPEVERRWAAVQASAAAGDCAVVIALERPAYGGATFTCTDADGHYWTVGSYRPRV
jgi:uncharacterized glyoxalase superfamily protein PhnB